MAKVLALGGSGFIGSYVVRELLGRGHEVCVIDNFSKYGAVSHDFYSHPKFRLVTKDVRAMYPLEFRGYDVVLCFAALIGGIQYFHRTPYQIARDNTEILAYAIDATLAVAEETIFYYFSSSMVYERVQRPVTEEDTLHQLIPVTNYGMQKLFGEFLVRGAHNEYGLNFVIVRPFNAVGGGELPHVGSKGEVEFGMAHVIPDFVYKSLIRQAPFEILGDGSQVRTFTHARDIADAVVLMVDHQVVNEDFNICGRNTFSVLELAERIWKKVNPSLEFPGLKSITAPPDDVKFRIGVSEKAKKVLGWEPQYDIDYIINDTLGFIRKNMRPPK